MTLPTDPAILVSYINTKLRDYYPTLDELCDDIDIDRAELESRLREAGYEYNSELNKFR